MPEKYNELMEGTSFQSNSQKLLAWQHRRALENILQKYECAYAICDQFGPEYLIKEGLKTGKGQNITIIQRPKAEKDIAVAAASILARREFLIRLQKMNNEYNVTFPKGASDIKAIINIAETLIKQFGRDILNKVAKVHFKTTKHILDKLSNE
jgi:ribonuclease HIII